MNLRIPTLPPRSLALLLILLTLAAYIPALQAGYIWDDDTLVTANPQMRGLTGLVEIWRGDLSRDYTPVTLSTFWLEWQAWGNNPVGYHLVNILLHALSALLLWRILARLRIRGAWLAALLFALHPVNVASVAWIAELKNTLSGALFFSAILCFLDWRESRSIKAYAASLALFLLAALSKGAVITLPAVLLLCIQWREHRVKRRDWEELAPFAAIAAVTALLTIHFQARAQHYGLLPDTFTYRVSRAGAAICYYLATLFWPSGLSPMREPWWPNLPVLETWLPAFAAAALWLLFLWQRRRWSRGWLLGYTCFLIMLLPVLGFVFMALMQETPAADWWQYLAAPAIFACFASTAAIALQRRPKLLPVIALYVLLLFIQTWRRASIYHSMETYCAAVTEEDPYAWTLQNNLGILRRREGRFADSEACFNQALRTNPNYVEAHVNLGNTYAAEGRPADQESEYLRAIRMRPGDPMILRQLANLYTAEGRPMPPGLTK